MERYLKLFTFLPLDDIELLMSHQWQNKSKRLAQHTLAKEVVELAHGAADAKKAETAHKEAFSSGTNTFSLGALRNALHTIDKLDAPAKPMTTREKEISAYKQAYTASSATSQRWYFSRATEERRPQCRHHTTLHASGRLVPPHTICRWSY